MHLPLSLPLLLASLVALPLPSLSSSSTPPPLHPRALSHPVDQSHHIIPRSAPSPSSSGSLGRLTRRGGGTDPVEGYRLPRLDSSTTPAWDDRFLLSFLLPPHSSTGAEEEEAQIVTLSLRPSLNLLHPSGVRTHTRTLDPSTGLWSTSELVLAREKVRAYEGWVVGEEEDLEKWVREEVAGVVRHPGGGRDGEGWARVVLVDDAAAMEEVGEEEEEAQPLRFQGAFQKNGETYSVQLVERYLKTKDELDPEPPRVAAGSSSSSSSRRRRSSPSSFSSPSVQHPQMVVIRDAAILNPSERIAALRKRGMAIPSALNAQQLASSSSFCAHDQLAFNVDPAHPVLSNTWEAGAAATYANSSVSAYSPLSFLARSLTGSSEDSFVPFDHTSSSHFSSSHRHRSYSPRGGLIKRQGDDISGSSGTSSNFISSIGSTSGCPKTARVVFVGVAADCTYVENYGSTDAARTQILTDFNTVSALYQSSFNVSLGIVELRVMNSTCPTTSSQIDSANPWNLPCPSTSTSSTSSSSSSSTNSSIGIDLNSRLSVFSQWRGDKGGSDGAGLWHLLTACQTGSEVGVAWLGQLCRVSASSSSGQTTSGTGVTAITRNEWAVVAHEIGHNFGAIHDCADGCSLSGSCCPLSTSTCNANANYIMSPVSEKNVTNFSPCSIGNICTTLSNSLNTSCLATPGASGNPAVISLQSCGNGILEAGEECDPGSDTTDPCCDASTCKFAAGAVCDPKNSGCCTTGCQIATNGTVCRAAVDETCDKAEVCSGTDAVCPEDEYEKDGKGCGSGLSCASGVCTSRNLQCQNAGSSLNLTTACSTTANTGCSIACSTPGNSRSCTILDQTFRDGTSCGLGGRCENGSCKAGSVGDTVSSWVKDNLRISIPVIVVGSLIILAILYGLIKCCCCRGRRNKAYVPPKGAAYSSSYAPQQQPQYQNGYYPPPPQQQQQMYGGGGYAPNYGGGGGGGGYAPPSGPPPAHPSSRGNVYRQ